MKAKHRVVIGLITGAAVIAGSIITISAVVHDDEPKAQLASEKQVVWNNELSKPDEAVGEGIETKASEDSISKTITLEELTNKSDALVEKINEAAKAADKDGNDSKAAQSDTDAIASADNDNQGSADANSDAVADSGISNEQQSNGNSQDGQQAAEQQSAAQQAADQQAAEEQSQAAASQGQSADASSYASSGEAVYINAGYAPDLALSGDLYSYGWDIINNLNSGAEYYAPAWGQAITKGAMDQISTALLYGGFAQLTYSYADGGDGNLYDVQIHNFETTKFVAATNYDQIVAELHSIVYSAVYDGMDKTDALLALNNEIAGRMTYEGSNSDYGTALVNGYYGNCTVYADLYKMACEMIGVNASLIEGYANGSSGYVAHAWNYVPGYGYIDVTFNDATGNAYLFSESLWGDHGDIFNEVA